MSTESSTKGRTGQIMEVLIRVGLVLALLVWAFRVVAPFLNPLIWGAILAIALYPVFLKVSARFGDRKKLVGILFMVSSIALIIVPSIMLVGESVDGVQALVEQWKEGKLEVPPPSEKVKEWPLVGEKLYTLWGDASKNLASTLRKFGPQLTDIGGKFFGMVATGGAGLLGLAFSLVLAGIFMINGEGCIGFCHKLGVRLAGDSGKDLVNLATGTIRGVALGVVGTAVIQAVLAAIGMAVMGIPLAAMWAFLVLMLAVIQLPPLLILGPMAAYAFTTHDPVPATIFAVWCLIVSGVDGILKPMLMGRGVDIPMLVILVGALGGMMMAGIVGLFVGGVVVALAYRLFLAWLDDQPVLEEAGKKGPEEAAAGE